MDRIALQHLLDYLGVGRRFVKSVFVEMRDDYSAAIESHWDKFARDTGAVPHRRLVRDVWELFRESPSPLRTFAAALPAACLLLVIAGTPCQQLTVAGPLDGRMGLCGRDSHSLFCRTPHSLGPTDDET